MIRSKSRSSLPLLPLLSVLLLCARNAQGQTVSDIWETTSDKSSLFKHITTSNIKFGSDDSDNTTATIEIDTGTTYQEIFGFGASLTDSSAYVLNKLKESDESIYQETMKAMFDVSLDADSAGMNYIRIPIGSSDFSPNEYTYADNANDTDLSTFSLDTIPEYFFPILSDIKDINNDIKIHLVPWSPPGWMKDSNSINAGNFLQNHSDIMGKYLYKSVDAFSKKGFTPYAISIQNEPQSDSSTVPSTLYTTKAHAAVGVALRKLLDSNGYQNVKVIGYEHNWDNAATYASQLMEEDGAYDAFAGVAFHCYIGKMANQDKWHNNFPDKELYFTECSGVPGSDFWSDIQYYMYNIYIGGLQHWSQSGLMWNFALDPEGLAYKLPGAGSCGSGCRGVISVSGSTVTKNQEYYAMAHASKAILPVKSVGEFGKRIGVQVDGDSLTVGAYATKSDSGTRYSIVVMNTGDDDLKTTISFENRKAVYSFPVGLTTMSWTS
ncbi:glycoside hydrolase family 30 [Pyrrhoderma noxium]|uniref:Glycoside hydrolase family 30 n=1 Tax=Pyrrhoderma noxium TaxID=2282107 RepID=A0A286U7J3_9AGAM|nr:glycoside hydrolase family 30 [Pyrrhoderma noxium]